MIKKIITISLASVSALALMNVNAAPISDTAQATQPSHVVKKHHHVAKHKPNCAAAATNDNVDTSSQMQTISVQPTTSGEVPTGVYVTGQLGYAANGLALQKPGALSTTKANGIAGRVALGYKLTNNVAMEVGFLDLNGKSVKGGYNSHSISSNQYAMDVAAKGIMSVAQNVNVYGKVGVAYLTTRLQEDNSDNAAINLNQAYGVAKHKWAPEVAVGVSYDVTPNISVDTSITHIHPTGSDRPGNINFAAVGLGYTFG